MRQAAYMPTRRMTSISTGSRNAHRQRQQKTQTNTRLHRTRPARPGGWNVARKENKKTLRENSEPLYDDPTTPSKPPGFQLVTRVLLGSRGDQEKCMVQPPLYSALPLSSLSDRGWANASKSNMVRDKEGPRVLQPCLALGTGLLWWCWLFFVAALALRFCAE